MSGFWENDPVVEEQGNFWDKDPVDAPVEAQKEEVTNLPLPRPNMFGSMDDDTAKTVYDSYSRHPNAKVDEEGNVLYRGVVVPKPEGNEGVAGWVEKGGRLAGKVADTMNPFSPVVNWLGEKAGVDMSSEKGGGALAGGLLNIAKNVATGGLGLGQTLQEAPGSPAWIASKLGMSDPEQDKQRVDFSNELVRGAEDNIPEFNPKGTADRLISGGIEIVAGLVVGNKATQAAKAAGVADSVIAQAIEKAPKIIRWLSKSLIKAVPGAVGMGATTDGNNDTLAVGEDALVPILQGLDGKSKLEGQAIVEKRLNVIYDNLLIAAPTEALADAGKAGWNFINDRFFLPIKGSVNENAKEKIIIKDFMNAVSNAVDALPGSKKAREWEQKIVSMLRDKNNSVLKFDSTVEGVGSREVPLSTTATVNRGLAGDTSDEAAAVKKIFAEREKTAIAEGGSTNVRTVLAAERPVREAEHFIQENRVALGGDDKIERGAIELQNTGRSRVNNELAKVEQTQAELDAANAAVPDFLRSGPAGSTINKASGELGSMTRLDRNTASDKILDTIESGSQTMRAHKDRLYKDFGDTGVGVPDSESLDEALMDVGLGEANSPLPAAIQDMITSSEGNLGSLYTDVAPRLNEIMTAAVDQKREIPPSIKALYDNITKTQPAILKKQADEFSKLATRTPEQQAIIDASNDLESAAAFYKDYYKKYAKDGAVVEIDEALRNRRKVTGRENAGNILANTIRSDQPAKIDHLIETLSKPEYGGSPKMVLDWIKGDAGDNIRDELVNSGLKSLDAKRLTNLFKPYRQATRNLPGITKELDTLQATLMKNKDNITELEKILTVQAGEAARIKNDIYGRVLKDFLDKEGVPNPDGYTGFKSLFKNPNATGTHQEGILDEVLNHAEGKPIVKEAMQSAYLRLLKEEISTSTGGATTDRVLSAAKLDALLRGENNFLLIGQKVFSGEKAPVIDFLQELLNPSLDITVSSKGGSFQGGKDVASVKKAKEAVGSMVRIAIGQLNPTGTAINTWAGKILEFLQGDDRALRIADRMMSGPDSFLAIYDKFAFEGPTKENARLWFKWLVAAGVANDGDYNKYIEDIQKENKDAQTKDAFSK